MTCNPYPWSPKPVVQSQTVKAETGRTEVGPPTGIHLLAGMVDYTVWG